MDKLSGQLTNLAARVAKAEDVITAAQDRDRQRLLAQQAELKTAVEAANNHVAAAVDSGASWWVQTRASADDWFAAQRAKAAEHRDQHDARKAQHRAEDAEAYAADAIDFAAFALDQAEYAIVDAALARVAADALAAG